MIRQLSTALALTASLTFAISHAHAKEWKHIRVAVEGTYPPFSEVNSEGELVGFDIDIAKALCAELMVKCSIVQQKWESIIPGLLAKKYDAIIASMYISEERDEKVDFTEVYYRMPLQFAAHKDADIEISNEGLAGKVIGVPKATLEADFVVEEFGDVATVRQYASQNEVFLDAAYGRIDLVITAVAVMKDGFLETPAGQDWDLIGPLYAEPEYFGEGAAIAVREEDDDLERMFDAALDAILANGTYRKIQDKYFDFNIYGKPYGDQG